MIDWFQCVSTTCVIINHSRLTCDSNASPSLWPFCSAVLQPTEPRMLLLVNTSIWWMCTSNTNKFRFWAKSLAFQWVSWNFEFCVTKKTRFVHVLLLLTGCFNGHHRNECINQSWIITWIISIASHWKFWKRRRNENGADRHTDAQKPRIHCWYSMCKFHQHFSSCTV